MRELNENFIKKVVIYLIISVYAFGLIKPVMPVIKDVLAHTFFKLDHITNLHYENGKYHMHLELLQEAKESIPKHSPLLSNTEFLFSHIKSPSFIFKKDEQQITEINTPYLDVPIEITMSTPKLPPKS